MLEFWKLKQGQLCQWTIEGQSWMGCFVPGLRQLTLGLWEMGMELPTIPCQVVTRTDASRMISSGVHNSGN